jgi:dihydroorotate dehydrogenase
LHDSHDLYGTLLRPVLFLLNPEFVHRRTIAVGRRLARSAAARRSLKALADWQAPELAVELMGLKFRNPIGLAAGFDKHAEIYPLIADVGFGHMEIGSVSLRPWRGNPSPTLLRLPRDHALINRLGLNSHGADNVGRRLSGAHFEIPTGVNLVKTADPRIAGDEAIEDYVSCVESFRRTGSFLTLNLSCPNSADGRTFEDPQLFSRLMTAIDRSQWRAPDSTGRMFVKLSPDLDHATLDRLLEIAESFQVSGYVIANTTLRREHLETPAGVLSRFGPGGLSGTPLKPYARAMVQRVAARVAHDRVIIACGGVGSDPRTDPAEEVWDYLKLGASMVQLHTGLIYSGPGIVGRINRGLVAILKREGIRSLSELLVRQRL